MENDAISSAAADVTPEEKPPVREAKPSSRKTLRPSHFIKALPRFPQQICPSALSNP